MRQVMFTPEFLSEVCKLCRSHKRAWDGIHSPDCIERAFAADSLTNDHIELWMAARVRIALLNPNVPAEKLWDPESRHHDAQLDSALPYHAFRWFERHLSFGDYGNGAGPSAAGPSGDATPAHYDKFRKRRAASDIARGQPAKSYNATQDVNLDDAWRPTRHRDGVRARHKAALHTGKLVDCVTSSGRSYVLYWEEVGWREAAPAAAAAVQPVPTQAAVGLTLGEIQISCPRREYFFHLFL